MKMQQMGNLQPSTDTVNTVSVIEKVPDKEISKEDGLLAIPKEKEPIKVESFVEVAKLKTQIKKYLVDILVAH